MIIKMVGWRRNAAIWPISALPYGEKTVFYFAAALQILSCDLSFVTYLLLSQENSLVQYRRWVSLPPLCPTTRLRARVQFESECSM